MIIPALAGSLYRASLTANPYMMMLAHFNGTDGATTTVDSTGRHTLTLSGGAELDTAVKKLGSAALLFNGAAAYGYANDTADWAMGTGDYSMEAFVLIHTVTAGAVFGIFQQVVSADNRWMLYWQNDSGTKTLNFYMKVGGVTKSSIACTFNPTADTWYHVAQSRQSGVVRMFIDGTSTALSSNTGPDETIPDFAANMEFGRQYTGSYNNGSSMDEAAIFKGQAYRWADFTPPTVELSPYI